MNFHRSMAIERETELKFDLSGEPQGVNDACGSLASGDGLRFRPITTADLDDIMVIERSSFGVPWSVNFFRQELQVACARSILAESESTVLGYVLFWLLPGAIDIHNIAVRVDYRRRGIARLLLDRVLVEARRQGTIRVLLEVRRSNVAAQKLYESMGFRTTGIRKGYYSDNGEDALAMTLDLAGGS